MLQLKPLYFYSVMCVCSYCSIGVGDTDKPLFAYLSYKNTVNFLLIFLVTYDSN